MTTLVGSEWRGYDIAGKSVAVVATADEAARIVPAVVSRARSVKVFQHEPAWVAPLALPVLSSLLARINLRLSVRDSWTRRLLTPSRFTDSDVVVSSAFYRALQEPNCKLVAWPVCAVLPDGVRTAEGIEHRADIVILSRTARQELAA